MARRLVLYVHMGLLLDETGLTELGATAHNRSRTMHMWVKADYTGAHYDTIYESLTNLVAPDLVLLV